MGHDWDDEHLYGGRDPNSISTHCVLRRHGARCQDESGLLGLQHGKVCMCRCHDDDNEYWEDRTYVDGACVAFGLMGMAQAIKDRS